jgi:hypothetical protein
MRRLYVLLSVSAALGSSLLAAQPALGSPTQVIQDCRTHLTLTHTYSASELSQALVQMPSDIKEYTNCFDLINHALQAALAHGQTPGGGGAGSGSDSSFLPTPLIVVLVVLVLGAGGFGVVALRKRGGGGE